VSNTTASAANDPTPKATASQRVAASKDGGDLLTSAVPVVAAGGHGGGAGGVQRDRDDAESHGETMYVVRQLVAPSTTPVSGAKVVLDSPATSVSRQRADPPLAVPAEGGERRLIEDRRHRHARHQPGGREDHEVRRSADIRTAGAASTDQPS
jgi:hypothetical protein